jgi:hypothetical protein
MFNLISFTWFWQLSIISFLGFLHGYSRKRYLVGGNYISLGDRVAKILGKADKKQFNHWERHAPFPRARGIYTLH